MNKETSYFKTKSKVDTPFGRVFLNAFYENKMCKFYSVTLHFSQGEKRKWRFSKLAAAEAFLTRLKAGDEKTLAKRVERTEDYIKAAREILSSPGKAFRGQVKFTLLAAMEKLDARTSHHARLSQRDTLCRRLSDLNAIPKKTSKFLDWLERALDVLVQSKDPDCRLATNTIHNRISLFRSILSKLSEFSYAFGPTYSHNATLVAQRCKSKLRKISALARAGEHFHPLTKSEIEMLISAAPTFALKLRLLAQLSGGFRAGQETERARYDHLVNGKLLLREIVTKVKDVSRSPQAPLALRVILRLGYELTDHDKIWLSDEIPFAQRRLRATTASHLVYSRAEYMEVVERLGHADLAMMTRHYCKFRPADVNDSVSPDQYYGVKSVRVDGVEVAQGESCYDKFILFQLLRVLKEKSLDAVDKTDFAFSKQILLSEDNHASVTEQTATVADF